MLKGFVIGFLCFLLFLFLHVIIFHSRKIKYRFRTIVRIFYSLLPLYIFFYILIPADALVIMPADPRVTPGAVIGLSKIFNFLIGVFVYLFLFFGYCQFYFIVDRSISVRIMIELEKSVNKQLTFDQIKEIYNPEDLLLRRLGHMLDSKYIIPNSNYYKNTNKGHCIARIMNFLKEYLRLGPGG